MRETVSVRTRSIGRRAYPRLLRLQGADHVGEDSLSNQTVSGSSAGTEDGAAAEFGANEWLVDELYERFRADRNSVDKSWWPVLQDYHPVENDGVMQPHDGAAEGTSSSNGSAPPQGGVADERPVSSDAPELPGPDATPK